MLEYVWIVFTAIKKVAVEHCIVRLLLSFII